MNNNKKLQLNKVWGSEYIFVLLQIVQLTNFLSSGLIDLLRVEDWIQREVRYLFVVSVDSSIYQFNLNHKNG